MTGKTSVYETITAKIIAAVEADPGRHKMPWHRNPGEPLHMPSNALTANNYRGVNVVMLWVSAEVQGFRTPVWGTYRQWGQLGAQVRQGEKSTTVIFYKEYETAPAADTPDDDGKRRVVRASAVFNADQVDGAPPAVEIPDLGPVERNARFDAFVTATGAIIKHGGDSAFYEPSTDTITMPDEHRFCGTDTMTRHESWQSTLAHELSHWSGSQKRLNREFGKRFGNRQYAAEEIVAEMTAAFLCAELGITCEPRPDHAQYIAQYLALLKHDPKAIFTAAAKAAQAADYLKAFSQPAATGTASAPIAA